MRALVLLNLLNTLRKREQMQGFCDEFNECNNTQIMAQMLDSIYHMTLGLL